MLDEEGAEILHEALSGYATLRKFYDLRDAELDSRKGQKVKQDPRLRKKSAAAALLAVINSAADNIHGGLFDENRGSVVHVDGLLALLGEAMIFVNRKRRFPYAPHPPLPPQLPQDSYLSPSLMTVPHTEKPSILDLPQCLTLLEAIEDLSTVTSRIYAQCDEFLHSTLTAYIKGPSALTSPRQMLKRQMSSMTSGGGGYGSSSFSLVGSSLLDSQLVDAMEIDSGGGGGTGGEGGSSKALTRSGGEEGDVQRGWDWRSGMMNDDDHHHHDHRDDGADKIGEHLIRILRLGLAREVAACWMRGEGV